MEKYTVVFGATREGKVYAIWETLCKCVKPFVKVKYSWLDFVEMYAFVFEARDVRITKFITPADIRHFNKCCCELMTSIPEEWRKI